MTSRSSLGALALFGGLGAALVGCGSTDVGTPNTEKIDVAAAAQKQSGQGGVKARAGGGLDEGLVPAKPGEQTGMIEGGRK